MTQIQVPIWKPVAQYGTRVAWTSRYRDALDALAQNRKGRTSLTFFLAILYPENHDEHDPDAVVVMTRQSPPEVLGYLPRETAAIYRERMKEAGYMLMTSACEAVLSGGLVAPDTTYDYVLEVDLEMSTAPSPDHLVIHPELHQIDAYPELKKDGKGDYQFKVWLPRDALDNIKSDHRAHGWTTDSWNTVNYYLMNRQGIGLGHKVLSVPKAKHVYVFGEERADVIVEEISRRWITLRLEKKLS